MKFNALSSMVKQQGEADKEELGGDDNEVDLELMA